MFNSNNKKLLIIIMKVAVIKSRKCGFGSNFNHTILGIEYALMKGFIPKVEWYLSLYADSDTENVWDTYFDLTGISTEESIVETITLPMINFPKRKGNKYCLNSIFKNHVSLKPFMKEKIDKIFDGYANLPLVGVHLRNTDRVIEPQFASPGIDIVIKYLKNVLKEYSKVGLYIASDNIPDVTILKGVLDEHVVVFEDNDAIRSNDNTSVHGDMDSGLETKNSLKAMSIITDIFALARCDVIVRTCSNVTAASAIINPYAKIVDVSKEMGRITEEWVSE